MPLLLCWAVTKSVTETWDLRLEDVGTREHWDVGCRDLATKGTKTLGLGDVGHRNLRR